MHTEGYLSRSHLTCLLTATAIWRSGVARKAHNLKVPRSQLGIAIFLAGSAANYCLPTEQEISSSNLGMDLLLHQVRIYHQSHPSVSSSVSSSVIPISHSISHSHIHQSYPSVVSTSHIRQSNPSVMLSSCQNSLIQTFCHIKG